MAAPKIVFLDIETLPTITTTFTMFPKNPLPLQGIVKHGCLASAAWKWKGKKQVYGISQITHPGTEEHPDQGILRELWKVLSEADAVVAQNGDRFDMAMIRGRMVLQGFAPFKAPIQIDTLKLAYKLNLEAWKLDFLVQQSGLGRKIETSYNLWHRCLTGTEADRRRAFKELLVYNKNDVVILEKWYNRIGPWFTHGPNHALYAKTQKEAERTCPHCGKQKLVARGYIYSRTGRRRSFLCGTVVRGKIYKIKPGSGCGKWSSRAVSIIDQAWKNVPK